MLKKILLLLVFIIAGFLLYLRTLPDEFKYSRNTIIQATPEQIYQHINDLRKWNAWSPWIKMDPDMIQTFEGPETGVGSTMKWSGNQQIGEGQMTIKQSRPYEVIVLQLDFIKPMKATNETQFSLLPKDEAHTEIIWEMRGKNTMVGKAAGLVFDMEKMIGDQFEQGLNDLKSIIHEANTAARSETPSSSSTAP